RIFEAQGQTQIVGGEGAAYSRRRLLVAREAQKLASPVRRSVRSLDEPRRPTATNGGRRFLEARDKNAFAPGKTQLVKTASDQQPFDQIRQVCVRLQRGLG